MGNPNDHGGYYFVDYGKHPGDYICNREQGSFRHYIHYFISGTGIYHTEQGTFTAQEGDLVYLPKDIQYTAQFRDRHIISCGFTHFPEAATHRYLPQKLPDQFIPQFLDIPKTITPDSHALAKFYLLLSRLLPHMKETQTAYAQSLSARLRIYVWRNYQCQVKDMAAYCNMSVPNLYRILKESGAGTPNRIKQDVLIQKAMFWLSDTQNSVEQISAELGFSSTNYFRKVFKAQTGKSPRQFRREAKNSTGFIE